MYDDGTIEPPPSAANMLLSVSLPKHTDYKDTVILKTCQPDTTAHKTLGRWRRHLCGAIIVKVNDTTIQTTNDFAHAINEARKQQKSIVKIELSHTQWHMHNGKGIPVLQHNKMMNITNHLHEMKHGDSLWTPNNHNHNVSHKAKAKGPQLTHRKVQKLPNWEKFVLPSGYNSISIANKTCLAHPNHAHPKMLQYYHGYGHICIRLTPSPSKRKKRPVVHAMAVNDTAKL